jgi:hypothetical protein
MQIIKAYGLTKEVSGGAERRYSITVLVHFGLYKIFN